MMANKRGSTAIISLALALVVTSAARADHTAPVGSVGRLLEETVELEGAVRHSYLAYHVKSAVFRFANEVRILADCVRFGPRPIHHDHLEDMGCPVACRSNLYQVRMSFRSVEQYLYDTGWDLPQVYRAYLGVSTALNRISDGGPGPGPGPGPGLIRCTAVDAGWEEHPGGHVAFGRILAQAQRAAQRECERFHGRCRLRGCTY